MGVLGKGKRKCCAVLEKTKIRVLAQQTHLYEQCNRSVLTSREEGQCNEAVTKILSQHHRPKLVVQTRSPDVIRDIDVLRDISDHGDHVQVNTTGTTDDEDVRSLFEPLCPANKRRLEAIAEISNSGIDACITMTPLLWVSNAHQFAEDLISTGVQRFILQSFHLTRGKFTAGTRELALQKMGEKLQCSSFSSYEEHCEEVFEVLKHRLSSYGSVGVGKDGFLPHFNTHVSTVKRL